MVHRATVQHLLANAATVLRYTSETPRLDAELLLAYALGCSRTRLLAERDYVPTPEQAAAFQRLVERRARLEPVAYIVGHREFYGLDFLVDQRVLVPRPETELLVEIAVQRVVERQTHPTGQRVSIVDVGTGSGAIAVALAVHLPEACIYATDISADALAVAQTNVRRHAVDTRVTLRRGDLLEPLPERVDLIVSNPPYTILEQIAVDVRQHEPHLALDGGPDGLQVYQRLFAQAPHYLRPAGEIIVEIGATQSTAVSELARATFPSARITTHRDLAGRDRVVAVQV